MRLLATLFILMSLAGAKAHSQELFEMNRSIRALGMGNAYVSVVNNEDSLFYNPAGIGKNGGFFWTVADPGVGLNGLDALDSYSDITSSSGFEAALNSLYGVPLWAGLNAKTAVMTPFFAAAFYDSLDMSILVSNPTATEMTVNIVNDLGIAIGTGFSTGLFQFGAVAKRIERTGNRRAFGPSVIAGIIEGTGSPDDIFNNYDNKGVGYSLDLGFNVGFPTMISPNLAFVWKNVGNTKFSTSSPSIDAPPTDEQEWILGASFVADLPLVSIAPSIDFKHLDKSDVQLGKKIHFGVELGLPLIDLRAGYHQGYLSYGAGLGLGPLQIDFASWGVELGQYPGQNEDRRYMVQATIRIGFDLGLSGGSSSSASGSGSRSKSGSDSAFHRVKRRR